MMRYFNGRQGFWLAVFIVVLFFLMATALLQGPMLIPWRAVLAILVAPIWHGGHSHFSALQYQLIWQWRLLHLVTVVLAGAALGVAGAVMQGFLRNPLADPGLLGVSAGAGFAVVLLEVSLSAPTAWIPLGTFVGGFIVMGLLYLLSECLSRGQILAVVLGGVALNALLGALTLVLLNVSDNTVLRSVFLWSSGGMVTLQWPLIGLLAISLGIGLIIHLKQALPLDILSLGETDASTTGVSLPRLRLGVMVGVALTVGTAVALVGPIAFVGLMVPHIMRAFIGSRHRILIPFSGLGGAILLLLATDVSMWLAPKISLPLSALTALLGAPFFIWLLWKLRP